MKCLNVLHIQPAEVQSMCNEGRENDGCDIRCQDGYELGNNTLKGHALDDVSSVGASVGEATCTPFHVQYIQMRITRRKAKW